MLPQDIKKRKESTQTGNQTLDSHLTEKRAGRPLPYSDTLFQQVATEWLIATHQV